MKILLIIDSLNSGGAQRQIVSLAIGLKQKNYDVVLLTYSLGTHFQAELDQSKVAHLNVHDASFFKTLKNIFSKISSERPDVICAYLYRPALIALVSRLINWETKIFVSERSFEDPKADWSKKVSRLFYPLASKIIVNSKSQLNFLRKKIPWLRHKMIYIGNSVDLEKFHPITSSKKEDSTFKIISVGHVNELKNTKVLIHAVASLKQRGIPVEVYWVGRNYDVYGKVNRYYSDCVSLVKKLGLDDMWHWEGKRLDVNVLMRSVDLMVHSSFGEGFPNVVCEALASGIPVCASNVYDHPLIIKESFNGFLFNPKNHDDLAKKIILYYELSLESQLAMRKNCRRTAEDNFTMKSMIDSYELVFKGVIY